MSPESQQSNSGNTNAEIAFVQQTLTAADKSERRARIIVVVLGTLAVVAFVWMLLPMFRWKPSADYWSRSFASNLFFLVVIFALTMYLRQAINQNTRVILRAIANSRNR